MKIAVVLFAVIFGYITPTYSQLNRHREKDAKSEQFLKEKNDKFSNFKVYQFDNFLSHRERDNFNVSPTILAPVKVAEETFYSGDNMPCFHPKSGDNMPCVKPAGTFTMRVFKLENVIWGILW